jgi:hypothetical protein
MQTQGIRTLLCTIFAAAMATPALAVNDCSDRFDGETPYTCDAGVFSTTGPVQCDVICGTGDCGGGTFANCDQCGDVPDPEFPKMQNGDGVCVICHLGSVAKTINGTGGDDIICGGSGVDTISAGSGADYVKGNDGDDIISAGGGDDVVDGGAGNGGKGF